MDHIQSLKLSESKAKYSQSKPGNPDDRIEKGVSQFAISGSKKVADEYFSEPKIHQITIVDEV